MIWNHSWLIWLWSVCNSNHGSQKLSQKLVKIGCSTLHRYDATSKIYKPQVIMERVQYSFPSNNSREVVNWSTLVVSGMKKSVRFSFLHAPPRRHSSGRLLCNLKIDRLSSLIHLQKNCLLLTLLVIFIIDLFWRHCGLRKNNW